MHTPRNSVRATRRIAYETSEIRSEVGLGLSLPYTQSPSVEVDECLDAICSPNLVDIDLSRSFLRQKKQRGCPTGALQTVLHVGNQFRSIVANLELACDEAPRLLDQCVGIEKYHGGDGLS